MKPVSRDESLRLDLTCSRCGARSVALYSAVSFVREEDGVCRPCGIVLELPVIRKAFELGTIDREQALKLVAAL